MTVFWVEYAQCLDSQWSTVLQKPAQTPLLQVLMTKNPASKSRVIIAPPDNKKHHDFEDR
jgi:hypothetical protein